MIEKLSPPPVSRLKYALWGVGLMLFKYAVEYLIVTTNGGADYDLLQFFFPMNGERTRADWPDAGCRARCKPRC